MGREGKGKRQNVIEFHQHYQQRLSNITTVNESTRVVRLYLDLWFFPLINVGLFDLKVDALDAPCAAHDLDATEVRLEIVQHTLGLVQELVQSTPPQSSDSSHIALLLS